MSHDRKQDVSSLFSVVGLPQRVVIQATEHTYEVDARNPKNNWLYPAFRGFQILNMRLRQEGRRVETFASIGTGQGVDAIGAYSIFRPRHIILTDIHPAVISVAQENVLKNVPKAVRLLAYAGNLCEPLRDHGVRPDLIYANLPNIPFDGSGSPYSGQLTSTFFCQKWIPKCSPRIDHYLLGLQRAMIHEASKSLARGGSLVLNLGGRVPIPLVQKIFADAGLNYQELFTMFKVQSQSEWVLGGYARAEKRFSVAFDFYRFDTAQRLLKKSMRDEQGPCLQLKMILKPTHVTAAEAMKRFVYQHERIGHLVQVIRGEKL